MYYVVLLVVKKGVDPQHVLLAASLRIFSNFALYWGYLYHGAPYNSLIPRTIVRDTRSTCMSFRQYFAPDTCV